jgi:hypothetical protein
MKNHTPFRELSAIPSHQMDEILSGAAQVNASSLIWTDANQVILSTQFIKKNKETNELFFHYPSENKSFSEENRIFAVSLSLPEGAVFFQTLLLRTHPSELTFEFPKKIFWAQNRKANRYILVPDKPMQVEFTHPENSEKSILCRVIDISATGLSIKIKKEDEPFFQVGTVLENLKIPLERLLISTSGIVRHKGCSETASLSPAFTIGVELLNPKEQQTQEITIFILNHYRKRLPLGAL